MSAVEPAQAREACARLCVDFAVLADAREFEATAALFAADGVFDRLGQAIRGRDAILAALASRPAEVWTRHYVSNSRIDVAVDGRSATGHSYVLLFRGNKAGAEQETVHAEYRDVFALTDEGWRIQSRKVVTLP